MYFHLLLPPYKEEVCLLWESIFLTLAELSKGEFGKSDGIALAELKLRDMRVAHLQKESSYGSVSLGVGSCKPHC